MCPFCLILLFINLLSNSLSLVIQSSCFSFCTFQKSHLRCGYSVSILKLLNSIIACALTVYIEMMHDVHVKLNLGLPWQTQHLVRRRLSSPADCT